jgi:hypothetical protein
LSPAKALIGNTMHKSTAISFFIFSPGENDIGVEEEKSVISGVLESNPEIESNTTEVVDL